MVEFQKQHLSGPASYWNYTPANVILNDRFKLDMPRIIMYDWAHIYVYDGLADHEFGLCMKVLQKENVGTSYLDLGTYLSSFTFPKSCTNVAHLFTAEKNANNYKTGNFSCTGSEFLTLVPVIHRYFANVVKARGRHLDKVNSMLAV